MGWGTILAGTNIDRGYQHRQQKISYNSCLLRHSIPYHASPPHPHPNTRTHYPPPHPPTCPYPEGAPFDVCPVDFIPPFCFYIAFV